MRIVAQQQNQPQRRELLHLMRPSATASAAGYEVHPLLRLQRTMGNQVVQRWLQAHPTSRGVGSGLSAITRSGHNARTIPGCPRTPGAMQTTLTVTTPGDMYEQEADRVADQMVHMPESKVPDACPCGGGCPECQSAPRSQNNELLQTRHVRAHDMEKTFVPPLMHEVLHAPGEPLDSAMLALYEPRFEYDFSQVRIHTDARAAESARALNASAYTVGHDIAFARGAYDPRSARGQRLLAHELVHVIQHTQDLGIGSVDGFGVISRSPDDSSGTSGEVPSTLIYIVNNRDARLRNPDVNFDELKTGTTKEDAPLQKPEKLSEFLTDDAGEPQVIPSNTDVLIETERSEGRVQYSLVAWAGQEGWTRSTNLRNVRTATIPEGTEVSVTEKRTVGKNDYVHIVWDNNEGWVGSGNLTEFDLRATTFAAGGQRAASLTSSREKRIAFEQHAPESFMSVKEIGNLDKIIGEINNDRAYKRDPETGASQEPATIKRGTPVVVLEQRPLTVDGTLITNTRVLDLEGNEAWTADSNITLRSPRIFDASGLIKGSILDQIKNPEVMLALEQYFGRQVDALLSGKAFTDMQQELLLRARTFAGDKNLQALQDPLQVPEPAKKEDGISLSQDLITRLDIFYRFLNHAQLISGFVPGKGISGVRSFARAHELSVRWMLNPKSKVLVSFDQLLRFVRQLIEMEGWDPNTPEGTWWATQEQVERLKELVLIVESGLLDSGPGWSCPYPIPVADAMADPTLEICAIVAEIQKEYIEGQPKAQNAQAAEGYPEGDMRRWPNIRDTGISLHCGGEAIDIFFNYRFNYYDPIIDAVALVFGLQRPVKDSPRSPEYWHYERVGVPLGQRVVGEDGRNVEAGEP